MYKEILRGIENVAIWPEISLVIFFTFFVLLLLKVFTTSKKYVAYMENLPLVDDDQTIAQPKIKLNHEK